MTQVLVTRPAASLERKVVGGGITGFVTFMALAALNYYSPEAAAFFGPQVEVGITWLATVIGGYLTRSRRPMPVKDVEPVE